MSVARNVDAIEDLPERILQEDGTRDKLMLAFGALDADGDKKLSYEEFRRVVASAATARDPVLALDP